MIFQLADLSDDIIFTRAIRSPKFWDVVLVECRKELERIPIILVRSRQL